MENSRSSDRIPGADRSAGKTEIARISTSVLAYIGDAVYETWARRHVFYQGLMKPDRLHAVTIGYVRARHRRPLLMNSGKSYFRTSRRSRAGEKITGLRLCLIMST